MNKFIGSMISAVLLVVTPLAKAGVYGSENWGEMYWGDNPISAPTATPTISSVVADEDRITITLTDFPQGTGEDGWSAVTGYTVTCGDTSVETSDTSVTIKGLSSETEYACSITASNAVGESSPLVQVVTTDAALDGLNIMLICAAIDCGSKKRLSNNSSNYGAFSTRYDGRLDGDAVTTDDGLSVSGDVFLADGVAYVSNPIAEGKHYWETTALCGPDYRGSQIGIVGSDNQSLTSWDAIQASSTYYGIMTDGARKVNAYDAESNPPEAFSEGRMDTSSGDVFMVAVDMDRGEVFFGKNGVWLGSSIPNENINPAYAIPNDDYYAVLVVGAEHCVPHTMTTNFGASEFTYDVPSGYFKGYCPTNNCEVAQ